MSEQRQWKHGLLRAPFLEHEKRSQNREANTARDDPWIAPTQGSAFDDRAGQTSERADRERLPGEVEFTFGGSRRLISVAPRQPETCETNRQIDKKYTPPAHQSNDAAPRAGPP